jgi:hypothetical protein
MVAGCGDGRVVLWYIRAMSKGLGLRILRPIGNRLDEDGWSCDFALGNRRFHAVLVEDVHPDDTALPSYHVDFFEYPYGLELPVEPVASSQETHEEEPEFILTQAVLGFHPGFYPRGASGKIDEDS